MSRMQNVAMQASCLLLLHKTLITSSQPVTYRASVFYVRVVRTECFTCLDVGSTAMEQCRRQVHNCGVCDLHCGVAEVSLLLVYNVASLRFQRSVVLPSSGYGAGDEPVTQSDLPVERNPQALSRLLSPDTLHCMKLKGPLLS